jgi:hypothetical protein
MARPERLFASDTTVPLDPLRFPAAAVYAREAGLAHSKTAAPSAEGMRTNASASTRSMTLAGSFAIAIACRSPIPASLNT